MIYVSMAQYDTSLCNIIKLIGGKLGSFRLVCVYMKHGLVDVIQFCICSGIHANIRPSASFWI